MRCKYCRRSIADNCNICPKCGKNLLDFHYCQDDIGDDPYGYFTHMEGHEEENLYNVEPVIREEGAHEHANINGQDGLPGYQKWVALSFIIMFFGCNFVFGLVALVMATSAHKLWDQGNYVDAEKKLFVTKVMVVMAFIATGVIIAIAILGNH